MTTKKASSCTEDNGEDSCNKKKPGKKKPSKDKPKAKQGESQRGD
jgi:hypothetical protein